MLDIWPQGRLVELDEQECWEELSRHPVGRVAWCHEGRPQIVPVNFLAADGTIRLRTTPYSRLAVEARDHWVAFEVDTVDEYTRSGISVVVEGMASADDRDPATTPETWAEGTRTLVLTVLAERVSGRRLMPS